MFVQSLERKAFENSGFRQMSGSGSDSRMEKIV